MLCSVSKNITDFKDMSGIAYLDISENFRIRPPVSAELYQFQYEKPHFQCNKAIFKDDFLKSQDNSESEICCVILKIQ
ncbi:hypothetical protein B9Z55_025563 [Caenorhabditis nigoni]|uniref:Uncharacterized protein n=1 Tax=Caenorhabditis nigoni TaxID=1611254 RepID=A0A2G5SZF0_9PELO|nr:hypothetical protein B9Z55_025563 [Caenorhabditis nigoni]